ncbi:MAG: general secretion pathway protein GspB [Proteobacteria bacterium]|nr:general secretion pathway protein GspB [Pseudomonadota bacterium]
MSKREKIIIVAMVAAVLIGGYLFLFDQPSKPKAAAQDPSVKELEKIAAEVTANLVKEAVKPANEQYIVNKASSQWPDNPFFQSSKAAKKTEEDKPPEIIEKAGDVILTFSGYLEIGRRRMAVINGIEYEVGDKVESAGMSIKSISAEQVILVRGGQQGGQMVLTLDEPGY